VERIADSRQLQLITDFLNSRAAQAQIPEQDCVGCGSPMRRLEIQFFLYGSERSWKISLPLCPCCDLVPESLDSRSPVAARVPGTIS
jgi:hypothetical protein